MSLWAVVTQQAMHATSTLHCSFIMVWREVIEVVRNAKLHMFLRGNFLPFLGQVDKCRER